MNPSSEENIALLRELALSLLAPSFDPQAHQPQLLPGSLPASLPFNLPLPVEYQIIGSFVRNPDDVLIILDTNLSPNEVIAFYTEQMQAVGWSEPDVLRRHRQHESGFTHTFYGYALFRTFCKRGPALLVSAFGNQKEGKRTKIRLNIDTRSRSSPCTQSSEIFIGVGALLPSLEPPQGGSQQGAGGGGSSSESAATAATLDMNSDMLSLCLQHTTHNRLNELVGKKQAREAANRWHGTPGNFATRKTNAGLVCLHCFKYLEWHENISCN